MTLDAKSEYKVSDKAYNAARQICSKIGRQNSRKRAFKALICLDTLGDYLYSQGFKVDISKNLYKIPQINEEFEFTDLHYNGKFINILPVTNGNFVLIPKTHFSYNVIPDLYVAADYNQTSRKVRILGCIESSKIDKSVQQDKYFVMDIRNFETPDNIENFLNTIKITDLSDSNHNIFKSFFIDYLDGVLEQDNFERLIRHLVECKECRDSLIEFFDYESIVKNTSKYPELFADHTLDIVGAAAVNDEKYKDFEEVTLEIDKEPDEYEENDEDGSYDENGRKIVSASDDPLQILYGNGKNREIFNLLNDSPKRAAKSMLSEVMDEVAKETAVEPTTVYKEPSKPSRGIINPEYYTEDLSDGFEHLTTVNKENFETNKDTELDVKEETDSILSVEEDILPVETEEKQPEREVRLNSEGKPLFLEDILPQNSQNFIDIDKDIKSNAVFSSGKNENLFDSDFSVKNSHNVDFNDEVIVIDDEEETVPKIPKSVSGLYTSDDDFMIIDDEEKTVSKTNESVSEIDTSDNDFMIIDDEESNNSSSKTEDLSQMLNDSYEELMLIDDTNNKSLQSDTSNYAQASDDSYEDFILLNDEEETVLKTNEPVSGIETSDDDFMIIDDEKETDLKTSETIPSLNLSDDEFIITDNENKDFVKNLDIANDDLILDDKENNSEIEENAFLDLKSDELVYIDEQEDLQAISVEEPVNNPETDDFIPESLVVSEEDLISDENQEFFIDDSEFVSEDELIHFDAEDVDLVDENDSEYFSVYVTPSQLQKTQSISTDITKENVIEKSDSDSVKNISETIPVVDTSDDDFIIIDDEEETVSKTTEPVSGIDTSDDDFMIIDDEEETVSKTTEPVSELDTSDDDFMVIDDEETVSKTTEPVPEIDASDDDFMIIDDEEETVSKTTEPVSGIDTSDDDFMIIDDEEETVSKTTEPVSGIDTSDDDFMIIDDEEETVSKTTEPVSELDTSDDDFMIIDDEEETVSKTTEPISELDTSDDDFMIIDDEEETVSKTTEPVSGIDTSDDDFMIIDDEEETVSKTTEPVSELDTSDDDFMIIDDEEETVSKTTEPISELDTSDDDFMIIDDEEETVSKTTESVSGIDTSDDDFMIIDDEEETVLKTTEPVSELDTSDDDFMIIDDEEETVSKAAEPVSEAPVMQNNNPISLENDEEYLLLNNDDDSELLSFGDEDDSFLLNDDETVEEKQSLDTVQTEETDDLLYYDGDSIDNTTYQNNKEKNNYIEQEYLANNYNGDDNSIILSDKNNSEQIQYDNDLEEDDDFVLIDDNGSEIGQTSTTKERIADIDEPNDNILIQDEDFETSQSNSDNNKDSQTIQASPYDFVRPAGAYSYTNENDDDDDDIFLIDEDEDKSQSVEKTNGNQSYLQDLEENDDNFVVIDNDEEQDDILGLKSSQQDIPNEISNLDDFPQEQTESDISEESQAETKQKPMSQLDIIFNSMSEKEKEQLNKKTVNSNLNNTEPPQKNESIGNLKDTLIENNQDLNLQETNTVKQESVPVQPPKRVYREFKDAISAKQEAIEAGKINNMVSNEKIEEPLINATISEDQEYVEEYVEEFVEVEDDEIHNDTTLSETEYEKEQKIVQNNSSLGQNKETYETDNEYEDYDEDNEEFEEDDEEAEEDNGNKNKIKIAAIAAAVVIILAGAGFGAKALFMKKETNTAISLENEATTLSTENSLAANAPEETEDNSDSLDAGISIPENEPSESTTEAPKTESPNIEEDENGLAVTPTVEKTPQQPKAGTTNATTEDMNKAVTNAFSDAPSAIIARKVSWGVHSSIAADEAVRQYVQSTGRIIKQNLKNNLTALKGTQAPSAPVKVQIKYDKQGKLQDTIILKSCGNSQLDEIVLQSVKQAALSCPLPILSETLLQSYEQSSGNSSVNFSLTIGF